MPRKKTVEEPKPELSLEQQVMACPYQLRDASLASLRAAIERVVNPRGTTALTAGGKGHFLSLPPAILTGISRGGMPKPADEVAQREYQQAVTHIGREEMRLENLAQKARGIANALQTWLQDMGVEQDRLLLSTLAEQDRPEVESFVRKHERLIRTANSWTDKLRF